MFKLSNSCVSKILPTTLFPAKICREFLPTLMIPQDRRGGGGVFIMSIYPRSIARCQHIKVNGTQCGSPSLKSRRLCFFHNRWREARIEFNRSGQPTHAITSLDLPVLEDANSVQVAIMQVLRLILAKQLEPKIARLLLYGLQTASLNLKHADFQPYQPNVVIEPRSVGDTLLGANVWDPREYEPDEAEATAEEEEEPQAATASDAGIDQEETGDDPIPAQPAGKEHPRAHPAKTRSGASSSQPSLATFLTNLARLEQMQSP